MGILDPSHPKKKKKTKFSTCYKKFQAWPLEEYFAPNDHRFLDNYNIFIRLNTSLSIHKLQPPPTLPTQKKGEEKKQKKYFPSSKENRDSKFVISSNACRTSISKYHFPQNIIKTSSDNALIIIIYVFQ